ncbi:MAG: polymerase, partial [Rhizobacter sp.]|nr:polymerase [Rhizobacter sp.]
MQPPQPAASARLDAALSALAVLALSLPFLWGFTRPPSSNFWPLAASWLCVAALLLISAVQALLRPPWG